MIGDHGQLWRPIVNCKLFNYCDYNVGSIMIKVGAKTHALIESKFKKWWNEAFIQMKTNMFGNKEEAFLDCIGPNFKIHVKFQIHDLPLLKVQDLDAYKYWTQMNYNDPCITDIKQ